MPSKKKKYNARFPPARIKKIMQSDEEVGKVAQAVPVIISRALELFVESLLKKAEVVTQQRNAKTLTPSHLKQCIMSEQRFDFLRDLVATISDVQGDEESPEVTPRPSTSDSTAFVFQPPPGSSSSSSSMAGPSSSSSSAPPSATPSSSSDLYQNPSQNPNNQAEMSEFMMSLPNYLNVKHEDIKPKDEQNYSTVQQQQHHQHPVGHYQPYQQQQHNMSILNPPGANSNPYIPSSSQPSSHHQDHVNSYSHYYSQYEHSANGKLKVENTHHHHHHHNLHNNPPSSSSTVGVHPPLPPRSSYTEHGSSEHYYDKANEGYLHEPHHHNY